MRNFFRLLWEKMNEPRNECVLIILLPCLSVIIAGLILLPRLRYYSAQRTESAPAVAVAASAVDAPADQDAAVLPSSEVQPTPPVQTPQPTPEPVYSLERGWIEEDGKLYNYDAFGRMRTGLQQVDGKLYYFGQDGAKASALGIDVSFYNKGINWPAVKAQGIDFAILRAGGRGWETGLIYPDSCFAQNLRNAKAAGIDLGVYFYSTAVTAKEAVDEANFVLSCLNGTELEYPIFFDIEQSGDYPKGRCDRLSKAERDEIIAAFCKRIRDAGYRTGVYSGLYFFEEHVAYNSIEPHMIWLANYTRGGRLPNFSGRYDIWQFTEKGTVNGIRGIVDMNVIF